MRTIGILLIIVGAIGLWGATKAFGDIGISMGIAGIIGILCGIGFLIAAKTVNTFKKAEFDAATLAWAQRNKEEGK